MYSNLNSHSKNGGFDWKKDPTKFAPETIRLCVDSGVVIVFVFVYDQL